MIFSQIYRKAKCMIDVFCGLDCNSETGFRQGSVIFQTLFNILSCDMLEGVEEEPLQVGR